MRGWNLKDPEMQERYRTLLAIAWPAALEGALLALMNSLDTMMVGTIGPAAIAAVGLCSQPRMLLLLCGQAVCVGTTAIIARRKGEGRQDMAVSCLKQSLAVISVIGILMMLFGIFGAVFLVRLSGSNEETTELAATYMRCIGAAMLANCWALCICAAMRGIGKTRITLAVNMTANVVNVILNYCLIGGHFGFPALGVLGAGIATAIGTCVSCLMAVIMMFRKGYLCPTGTGGLTFDRETLESLFNVGTGSLSETVFMRIGFMLNSRLIAGLGTIAYATNQIIMQCTSLSFTLGDGIASAGTSLIGQSLGEKNYRKAQEYVDCIRNVSAVLSVGLIILFFFLRKTFATLFTTDPSIIEGASVSFIVILFGIFSQNKRVVLSGCLRGAGDVKFVAFVSLVSVMILRPAATWIFCYPVNAAFPALQMMFAGQWLSFDIDSVCRSLMVEYRIRKGKWLYIKV